MTKKPIQIIRHSTLRECLKAYGIPANAQGYWKWADADGTNHKTKNSTALSLIKRRTCWGWTEDKKVIHVWIGKRATLVDIVGLLAHEMGHIQRPFRANVYDEEQKAAIYASVALGALSAAEEMLLNKVPSASG